MNNTSEVARKRDGYIAHVCHSAGLKPSPSLSSHHQTKRNYRYFFHLPYERRWLLAFSPGLRLNGDVAYYGPENSSSARGSRSCPRLGETGRNPHQFVRRVRSTKTYLNHLRSSLSLHKVFILHLSAKFI